VQDAIEGIGLKMMSKQELEQIIDASFKNNQKLVEERGMEALGPLMGIVMKEARGKANAAVINAMIEEKLKQTLKK
jgi:glutamyl-tRNA(Gln) amidotransferase subunit E